MIIIEDDVVYSHINIDDGHQYKLIFSKQNQKGF